MSLNVLPLHPDPAFKRILKKNGCKILTISSGKGGVGKTITAIQLANSCQKLGFKCLILDGDMSLANIDVLLGLKVCFSLEDVFLGNAEFKDIIVNTDQGFDVIPAASGIVEFSNLSEVRKNLLFEMLCLHLAVYDVLIIDSSAGIGQNVLDFNNVADLNVVVTTPEPHSITDAYAIIKVLSENNIRKSLRLLVNMTLGQEEGLKVCNRLSDVSLRFLGFPITYAGHVPKDPQMAKLVLNQNVASASAMHTIAGQAWFKIMRCMTEDFQSPKGSQINLMNHSFGQNDAHKA